MELGNVAQDIETFLETFAETDGIEMIDMIGVINQVVQYSEEHEYSKKGAAGMILNGWMAGFMAGYRRGKQEEHEARK